MLEGSQSKRTKDEDKWKTLDVILERYTEVK
jgi:hypothetical protein